MLLRVLNAGSPREALRMPGSRMRAVDLVKHDINQYPGDRDVKPNGISPASDAAMAFEPSPQPRSQRQHDQRHHRRRQQRMRDKQREIHRPYPALSGEAYRTHVRMVVKI